MIRAAAIQFEAEVGNVEANLERCEALANQAAGLGADWIILPEFFSTGIANRPDLRENALPPEGVPAGLLRDLAGRHGAYVGGSTLVRDADGHVRNSFLLYGPDGALCGRHDKDIPTMWENRIYIGGGDPGRLTAGDLTVGVALCWEFMRTGTAERLAGRVDLVVGGSGWWSIPSWRPRAVFAGMERANHRRAINAAPRFAPYVGAPVVHAAHSGSVDCVLPGTGAIYRGRFGGAATITDPDGTLLAARYRQEGPGLAIADVDPRRVKPRSLPDRFWLQQRGVVAAAGWTYMNPIGRRQYARAHERRLDRAARASGSRIGT